MIQELDAVLETCTPWNGLPSFVPLRLGAVLACGEDLGSRMKLRVRDPECSVAAVGAHISAEDNGWSYMRSRSFSQTGTDSS